MLLSIEIIGWIAAILIVVVGLPQLVYISKVKKAENLALSSYWIFNLSLLLFSLYGFFLGLSQLVFAELAGSIIFSATLFVMIKYWNSNEMSHFKRKLNYALILFILIIIIIISLLHIINFYVDANSLLDQNSNAVKVIQALLAMFAPFIGTLAFLPQTIKGIKEKNLFSLPFFFVADVFLFNTFWIIVWVLRIHAYDLGLYGNMSFVFKNTSILSLILQSVSLIIAALQFGFWIRDVKGKKIIWF
ncbi:uncharacterized protein with PQ loop repeat [Mycoplasma testudineum]|uniref:Uncharacterized protein with PQ loop repeat n=1 Tax=Mycoplasma testudineum TaxID=244584 RepID=A0A4V3C2V6_9MOLU|nr:PQ-loop domain-containing transporter [Mycoplasma testudineum]OYD26708.1 hypothetical protein CG473_02820 [Mycoplasma testudineum]TDO19839.1 uncharacterized protein with PQ loop repeat [Mycoplasma testudineum]